jgi:hypothetical protein
MTRLHIVLPLFLLVAFSVWADDIKPAPKPATKAAPLTKENRMELIRGLNAELVYIRTPFPMGRKGLTLKNGQISPNGQDLQMMMATWGPAAKPGDRARITDIVVKDKLIHFEINGGPIKKQKWYQRITISGMGGEAPIAPSDPNANPRGSYVDLAFDKFVPDLTVDQAKELLRPVFDFNAKSAVEAYLETVPPKVKEAIKNHEVLVGMNREMVIYAKGRPPKRIREKDGETEYEEWIYGEPPKDVEFVRMVGDQVIRVETMKVTGEKVVRAEKEVDLTPQPSLAQKEADQAGAASAPDAPGKPTLRRPGEENPDDQTKTMPKGGTNPLPPIAPQPRPGSQDPTGADPNPHLRAASY